MQKINFQNLPNTTTPINATNLNAIQTNAETAINDVADDLSDYVDGTTAMGDINASSVTSSGEIAANKLKTDQGIEIFNTTPFIDFHFNNLQWDYTSRIIEETQGMLTFYGGINVEGDLNNLVVPKRMGDGTNITDGQTRTFEVASGDVYLFINSHTFARCALFLTIFNGNVSIDEIFKSGIDAVPTITLNGTTLTIQMPGASRSKLYRLKDLQSV